MKGKVLVIEDNISWSNRLKGFLESAGFHVEVVDNLKAALEKIENDLFHFITIDMLLDEENKAAADFEGWGILAVVKKNELHNRTPTMVITGYEKEYWQLKEGKKLEGVYFMGKGDFDRQKFITIVEKAVKEKDLRFKNDFRGD